MANPLENGDFLKVQALVTDYVWKLDQADVDGVLALFTEDCVFEDTAGNVYDGKKPLRDYIAALVATPEFRGRQHHIDNMRIEPTPDGYVVRSYWTVTKWRTSDSQKIIEVLGHSLDRFVRDGAGFRFAERHVHYWRDADCPWKPAGSAL